MDFYYKINKKVNKHKETCSTHHTYSIPSKFQAIIKLVLLCRAVVPQIQTLAPGIQNFWLQLQND